MERPNIKKIGRATTIGELKKMIKDYPDNIPFGFRNQPMQSLYEIKYSDVMYVAFQENKSKNL